MPQLADFNFMLMFVFLLGKAPARTSKLLERSIEQWQNGLV